MDGRSDSPPPLLPSRHYIHFVGACRYVRQDLGCICDVFREISGPRRASVAPSSLGARRGARNFTKRITNASKVLSGAQSSFLPGGGLGGFWSPPEMAQSGDPPRVRNTGVLTLEPLSPRERSGAISGPFGPILTHLAPFWTIWNHPDHLGMVFKTTPGDA